MMRRFKVLFTALVAIMILIICLLLISCNSFAFDKWAKKDTALQLTYSILHIVDWKQTRYIAKHPETYYERNPILGRHPNIGRVDTYFASTLLLHSGVSYLLSQPYRRYWQCIWIVHEIHTVGNNWKMGIEITF